MSRSTPAGNGRRTAAERPRPNLKPSLDHERALQREGHLRVAGLDEAGRGAWAGPVVAGAVILNLAKVWNLGKVGVRDSKQLSPRQRDTLYPIILDACLAYGIGLADAAEIDALGIVPATRLAMRRAIDALSIPPDALIIDALRLLDTNLPQRAFPFADSISLSVAAASILAKVTRDRMMIDLEAAYPGYGFDRHKGYGTRRHSKELKELGVCEVHRRTFRPIRAVELARGTYAPRRPGIPA